MIDFGFFVLDSTIGYVWSWRWRMGVNVGVDMNEAESGSVECRSEAIDGDRDSARRV